MISALFPGQGSQQTGMGKFLYENFSVAKNIFEEASDAIKINMKKLCFDGPEEDLQFTPNTQPALLTVSIVTARVVKETIGISFDFTAGHSVGEYASFVLAESLTFKDAVVAVRRRGEFMQEAVPLGQGGMVAVMGLNSEQVEKLCQWAEKSSGLSPLSPANYNAPGQIVCSGSQKLIEWVQNNSAKDIFEPPVTKMRLIPLKVSAPFHCSLMKPAEDKMRIILEDTPFADAKTPIVQNFTAKEESKASVLRENLIRQITGPVRWIQSVENLAKRDVKSGIELGSGKVLSGLIKKIDPEFTVYSVNNLEELKKLEQIL
ncbi:MAG: ACP S-malonyltransferase [Bdellovibrionaceae bacterium]|nr:ACP S-malonyltransferase [Pseudobdellovibrionaceae bacterium]